MPPKPSAPASADLFVSPLDELINMKHPLARLGCRTRAAYPASAFATTSGALKTELFRAG